MRQAQALHVMLRGDSVFLTGPPGAGKTYVLNQFIKHAQAAGKTVAVTASTGIAATHIGGTTIHSWSGLGIRDQLTKHDRQWLSSNDKLIKRYNGTDVLVIDEVSMLHGARLDMVNEACKLLRKNDQPFGGLQVILVGDLFQLPPVSRNSDVADFAHTSQAWQQLNPNICYIREQHRQSGGGLLEVLEAMRSGELEEYHAQLLQDRIGVEPDGSVPITRLYAHNVDVELINDRHLATLDGTIRTFAMQTRGAAAKVEQLTRSLLAPEILELKIGAEVMFVANNFSAKYVNGSRGRVVAFQNDLPIVKLQASDRELRVEQHTWVLEEDGKKRAEAMQLPLRLAWAITIHKSQGMSLDAAEIDLSKSFTPGMGYVALSRVRALEGLYLTGLNRMAMQLHPDIHGFDRMLQTASAALAADIPEDIAEPEIIPPEPIVVNQELLSKLKLWRLARASADQVAPFIIAHNTALEAIAATPPTNKEQLQGIKGFGPRKVAAYGDDIMRVVTEGAPVAADPPANVPAPSGWTAEEDARLVELFKQKATLHQVSSILERTPQEIWLHLADILATT